MRVVSLLMLLMLNINAIAGELSEAEIQQLHNDIDEMYQAYQKGDASMIVAKTHPSLYPLVGGEKAFRMIMAESRGRLMEAGVEYLRSELKVPQQMYRAGEEELCFVPRISVYQIQGKKIRSVGFMIAARQVGTDKWLYIDGTGLRKNKNLFWEMFPQMDRDIQFPPNYMEVIE